MYQSIFIPVFQMKKCLTIITGGSIQADVSAVFSAYGYGWHVDAGIHMIRMILSGIFEKLPNLKVITVHWGNWFLIILTVWMAIFQIHDWV